MRIRSFAVITAFAVISASCGGSSASNPSAVTTTSSTTTTTTTTTTPTTPAPTTATLTGTVTASPGGARISGATIKVLDGTGAGKTVTSDGSGNYSLTGLPVGNTNFSATASGYSEDRRGTYVTSGATLNFTLTAPIWTMSGSGADVFTMPSYVKTVTITGSYSGYCENFVVYVSSSLVVNEILGTCSSSSGTSFRGTYAVTAGQTEVKYSTGISWSFTEQR